MNVISVLAELLEMLQLGISVAGGHLVHGGCFGLTHSHLLNAVHIHQSKNGLYWSIWGLWPGSRTG